MTPAPALRDVLTVLDRFYPPQTAMSWDRVGLVAGDPEQPVRHVRFALDPTLAVVEEAVEHGADLLVTHHPLLMRGVHAVAATSAKGRILRTAIRGDLAMYCAHTNADVADPGVCDALAAAAGLLDLEPLTTEEGQGKGRVGQLPEPITLADLASRLADRLPRAPVGIRVSGDPDALVRSVAVIGGSGDDSFAAVRASGADVFITADLRHHPALEAREESSFGPPYLIDPGHWASEAVWLAGAAQRLRDTLADAGTTVEVSVSDRCTDPWDFVVAARAVTSPDIRGGAR